MSSTEDNVHEDELAHLRRLARVLDSTTDGIAVYDREWRFVYLNKPAEELGGKPIEELLGRVYWEVFPEAAEAPHSRELERAMTEGIPVHFENYYEPFDKWFEIHAYPTPEGITAYYHDISKRKRAELALRETDELNRRIIEAVPAGVVLVLPDGAIAHANEQAQELLGLAFDEFTSRYVHDFDGMTIAEDGSPLAAEDYPVSTCLRTGEPHTGATIGVRRPNGEISWGVYSAIPLRDTKTGGLSGAVVTFVDISERKRAEAALRESEQQLHYARKMETVGRLAGGIAHDFNNLMTIVGGYASFMLQRLVPGDPLCNDAEQIRKAAERATRLTRQLLAFGRRQILRPQIVDLNGVINEITKMLARLLGEDVDVRLHLAPNLGHIQIDPGQLEQVLVNLTINAREAMAEGGQLDIETSNVAFDEPRLLQHDCIEPGSYVALRIRDSGKGMDAQTLTHLFEPFFSTKEFGRGLGLSSIYGIVKQSGGSIAVDSEQGEGTTFTIYLPIAKTAVTREEAPKRVLAPASRGETILLVEDDPDVRALLEEVLEQNGYTTIRTDDPAEAVEMCEGHEGPIHLLVTDVVMPKISGPQLAERLVRVRSDMRVLFISGYVENDVTRKAVSSGWAAFLAKPFTPEEFIIKVQEVLEGARAGSR
jgi:PAS domain S-box-containing protein